MNKIRILYITNRFAPAGAETFILNRLQVLDRSRFEPYVAALRAGGKLKPEFEKLGVPTIEMGDERQLDPRSIPNLYAFLKRERIQIVEAHVLWAILISRMVARAAGVPIIITNEQNMHSGAAAHRADVRFSVDLTTRLSTACVYITHAAMKSFLEEPPKILQGNPIRRRIPNGIDVQKFESIAARIDRNEKRASLGIREGEFVIGNVGRLVPQKGQDYLIEAFAKVKKKVPNARLVIVGWGDFEPTLRSLAEKFNVANDVIFTGVRLDVAELLPTFDVFAFSSIHEAQGIAILEAMAAGVPIVSTNVDGIPDMIKHEETGLAVPSCDPAALADGVVRVFNEPDLAKKMVVAARALLQTEFTVEAAARAYERLYIELLEEAGIPIPPAAPAEKASDGQHAQI
ncbi:MAG: glycosyltransferase [Polyangiaceae bacterium]|nr:glycosyltransferase [Polyangiaceae bacterium]